MVVDVLEVEDAGRIEDRGVSPQEDVDRVPLRSGDPPKQREVPLERQEPLQVDLVVVLEDFILDLLGPLAEVVQEQEVVVDERASSLPDCPPLLASLLGFDSPATWIDEVNILVPGGNYGWPLVSLGRTYQGPWHSQKFQGDGFIDPVVYWTPAIAVSGLAFYTGDKLPKWKGDVFVGGLRYGEIIGTGQIQRILFNERMEERRREALLTDWRHRMRDIRQGPDGFLYVLVDDDDGAVLRIEPAS